MILSKIEIAKRQLETAIELYFAQKDTGSVIQLAGASEEILGKIAQRSGKKAMIDHLVDLDKRVTGTGREFKIVNQEVNGTRNALKHANDPFENEVEIESGYAESMLIRAIANYNKVNGKITPVMQQFYEHLKLVQH